ncbi:MAG: hypothetical protein ACI3VA_04760 [Candidatus Limivicinus sp.]
MAAFEASALFEHAGISKRALFLSEINIPKFWAPFCWSYKAIQNGALFHFQQNQKGRNP